MSQGGPIRKTCRDESPRSRGADAGVVPLIVREPGFASIIGTNGNIVPGSQCTNQAWEFCDPAWDAQAEGLMGFCGRRTSWNHFPWIQPNNLEWPDPMDLDDRVALAQCKVPHGFWHENKISGPHWSHL